MVAPAWWSVRESRSTVLGVLPDWSYKEEHLDLAPGDRLVLYTDGITEIANQDGEEFGEEQQRGGFFAGRLQPVRLLGRLFGVE